MARREAYRYRSSQQRGADCVWPRLRAALLSFFLLLPGLAQAFYIYSDPARDWENNKPLMLVEGQVYRIHPESGFALASCDLHTLEGGYHSTLSLSDYSGAPNNVASGTAPALPAGTATLTLQLTCRATDTSQALQRFQIEISSATPVPPVSEFLVGITPNDTLESGTTFAIYPLDATHTFSSCSLSSSDGNIQQTLALSGGEAIGLAPALPAGSSRLTVTFSCTASNPAGAVAGFSREVVPGSASAGSMRATLATAANGLGTLEVQLTPPADLLDQPTRFWVSAEFFVPGADHDHPLLPQASQFFRVDPASNDGAAWLQFRTLSLSDYVWQTLPFAALLKLTIFDDLPTALLSTYKLRVRLAYQGSADGGWILLGTPILDCRDGLACHLAGE